MPREDGSTDFVMDERFSGTDVASSKAVAARLWTDIRALCRRFEKWGWTTDRINGATDVCLIE